jgi:putative protease
MKNIELLSPAGNFESLKAAVQSGADAVYFGADKLNARINSTNFNNEELAEAIKYAKLRNVKTHLTLNILIQNDEFKQAIELVEYVYKMGIDAVIVQDLGLAKKIIEMFPGLEVHASTQMTTYNIEGVNELEKIGFNRVVLARELSIEEIKKICKNSNIDIEIFVHGALCICYSGQCLMSSIIGERSGNRGKCAGACRLPYTLLKNNNKVDNGYLLSSKDVCTLDILPEIINSGVKSLKIEGRMKSPEYVAIVTSIYRKYIDLANSNKPYIVDKQDKEKLLQIFNRGGFSTRIFEWKIRKRYDVYIKTKSCWYKARKCNWVQFK